MSERGEAITVLMCDDDADERMLVKEVWEESRLVNELRFVEDGEELLDYLCHRGKYAEPTSSPHPGLILLDLNMPRKDGCEALKDIKADPELSGIPVVIMTTSKEQEDVLRTRTLGANAFVRKPVTSKSLANILEVLGNQGS